MDEIASGWITKANKKRDSERYCKGNMCNMSSDRNSREETQIAVKDDGYQCSGNWGDGSRMKKV